jgi:hypothetical protein
MRKFVVDSQAHCAHCDFRVMSRTAENWAKKHAKQNPLHRVYFQKTWEFTAPLKIRITTKKRD